MTEPTPTTRQQGVSIQELLAEYENLAAMLDTIKIQHQDTRNYLIPVDIQRELEAVDAEFSGKLEAGEKLLEERKKALQEACKNFGETIPGQTHMVVWRKGSWKIKSVEALLVLAVKKCPEIMDCLEKTEPSASVQIRRGA